MIWRDSQPFFTTCSLFFGPGALWVEPLAVKLATTSPVGAANGSDPKPATPTEVPATGKTADRAITGPKRGMPIVETGRRCVSGRRERMATESPSSTGVLYGWSIVSQVDQNTLVERMQIDLSA